MISAHQPFIASGHLPKWRVRGGRFLEAKSKHFRSGCHWRFVLIGKEDSSLEHGVCRFCFYRFFVCQGLRAFVSKAQDIKRELDEHIAEARAVDYETNSRVCYIHAWF